MLDLFSELLILAKEFDKIEPDGKIDAFKNWLVLSEKLQKHTKKADESNIFSEISKQHARIKQQTREIIKSVGLSTLDDYYYLLEIQKEKQISKSKLITNRSHEMPTGTEIIKRLLKRELIQQESDPKDRRIKCLSLKPIAIHIVNVLKKQLADIENEHLRFFQNDELYTLSVLLKRMNR